ncbi:MAG: MurR/RpiR family transcriptional regulator [Synergistales bacterium]|nr:MurR/RpiR family transcriptional regulator [Synergistales bacterium]
MLFAQIKRSIDSLSASHRKLASFILEHPDEAAFMTASQIARRVNVSESTVFRFATFLGYKGVPDLKAAIQETVMEQLSVTDRGQAYRSEEGSAELPRQVMQEDLDTLARGISRLDTACLYRIAERIAEAPTVYVTAFRSSLALAHYLVFYLSWFRPHVVRLESELALERIANMGGDSLVVGITFNKCIRETVDVLRTAKLRGIPAVAVTNCITSPAARWADDVLTVPCNLNSFVDSYVAPVSLLNALVIVVSRMMKGNVERAFPELERLWKASDTYVVEEDRGLLEEE